MSKFRIIERTNVNGRKSWVIQQKHFLFIWWWVDAWVNSPGGGYSIDSFNSLEEAKNNLCYYDGTKVKEKVVFTNIKTKQR